MFRVTEEEGAIRFPVKVIPKSSKNAVAGVYMDSLKIKITAPPVDGEANEACVKFLAKMLKVPKNSVEIVSGHTGRNKVIRVWGMETEEFLDRAGLVDSI